jgi:ABC-type nitrate/sulfonate/bicarbonate transport system permease component
MIKTLFKIGGTLPKKTALIIEVAGFVLLLFLWWVLTKPFNTLQLQYNVNNAKGSCTFKWTGPDGFNKTTTSDGFLKGLEPGIYKVELTDSTGEKISTSIDLSDGSKDSVVIYPKGSDLSSALNNDEKLPLGIRMDVIRKKAVIQEATLPSPYAVLSSYGELHFEKKTIVDKNGETKVVRRVRDDGILINTWASIKLNVLGYVQAILVSLIVGFIIGLVPFFNSLWSRYIDAIRFVPLAAVTGMFVAWFGLDMGMKVQFLSFGIFVFLVPVVVQRIKEVDRIYIQTSYTLGATDWQTIRKVYWPHVTSKIIDDVRVLTAISWTYIIVAEMVNISDDGGLGAFIFKARRASRLDHVFAILALIVLIGFIQDLIFRKLDRWLFPHKYQKKTK